jgi:hypothetical protein
MALDENKLHEFLGRALIDLGGAVNAVLMSIGDELGLYKAPPSHWDGLPSKGAFLVGYAGNFDCWQQADLRKRNYVVRSAARNGHSSTECKISREETPARRDMRGFPFVGQAEFSTGSLQA